MFSVSRFLGNVEVGDPLPSPASRKTGLQRCGDCQIFMLDLDPHPSCLKFLPRDSKSLHYKVLFGYKGDLVKGGGGGEQNWKGKPSCFTFPPGTSSPGRSRLEALEAGFSLFKSEIASMFSDLTGCLTASHSPVSNTDGSQYGGTAHSGDFPSGEPVDPPASQRCLTAPPSTSAISHGGLAAGLYHMVV